MFVELSGGGEAIGSWAALELPGEGNKTGKQQAPAFVVGAVTCPPCHSDDFHSTIAECLISGKNKISLNIVAYVFYHQIIFIL